MKPLMSQLQNQAALDDLLGSSKVRGGNFDLPGSKSSSIDRKKSNEPNFNDMLLAALQSEAKPKQNLAKAAAPKIPDASPKIDAPKPKTSSPIQEPKTKEKQLRSPDLGKADDKNERLDTISKDIGSYHETENAAAPIAQNSESTTEKPNQSANSEAKASLAPLKKQLSNKNSSETLLNGNAVLAFISGRLDKLEPEALPAIITDSLLIKQAMSANDIAEFMQTPMPISELAKLLELDQGLLNKAALDGLDPTKVVMPKDFINALGLDAGRVTAELTMLSQKLPIEGVKSYINRAKAMADKSLAGPVGQPAEGRESLGLHNQRAVAAAGAQGPQTTTGIPNGITSPIEITMPSDLSAQSQINPLDNINYGSGNINFNTGALSAQPAPITTGVNANVTQPNLKTQRSNSKYTDPSELLLAQSIQSGTPILAGVATTVPVNHDQIGLTNDRHMNLPESIDINVDIQDPISSSNVDLFSDMNNSIDSSSTLKIDFSGDGISQRSLEEHLLDKGLSTYPGTSTESLKNEGQLFDLRQSFGDKSAEIGAEKAVETINEFSNQIQNNGLEAPKENLIAASEKSMAQQDFSGSQGDQHEMAGDMKEFAADIASSFAKNTVEAKSDGEMFINSLNDKAAAPSKSSIAHKILGQAQMMLKNGGGTMRVDMEAPGIGKIDVAINLINNQLDVRIVTASDQARDMIAKEVSGLRDGLIQQGISLRGLEVGKAGESTPKNFAGQGQQQFANGGQDQRASYNDMKEYVQSFKNSYNPNSRTGIAQALPTNRWSSNVNSIASNGRLEIRA